MYALLKEYSVEISGENKGRIVNDFSTFIGFDRNEERMCLHNICYHELGGFETIKSLDTDIVDLLLRSFNHGRDPVKVTRRYNGLNITLNIRNIYPQPVEIDESKNEINFCAMWLNFKDNDGHYSDTIFIEEYGLTIDDLKRATVNQVKKRLEESEFVLENCVGIINSIDFSRIKVEHVNLEEDRIALDDRFKLFENDKICIDGTVGVREFHVIYG